MNEVTAVRDVISVTPVAIQEVAKPLAEAEVLALGEQALNQWEAEYKEGLEQRQAALMNVRQRAEESSTLAAGETAIAKATAVLSRANIDLSQAAYEYAVERLGEDSQRARDAQEKRVSQRGVSDRGFQCDAA